MKNASAFFVGVAQAYWLLAPFLILACVAGFRALRKRFRDDNFGCVEQGRIFRSGQLLPLRLERLIKKHGIRTIVHANELELSIRDESRFRRICRQHGVAMIPIIMPGDGRGEFGQYDAAVRVLNEDANLPVLVCCARGTHRTGAIIASYRVLIQGWPVPEALKEMERHRFRPRPHRYRGGEHPLLPHLREYFSLRSGNRPAASAGIAGGEIQRRQDS